MDAYERVIIPSVAIKLRELSNEAKTIEEVVNIASSSEELGISIAPFQVKEEVIQLLRTLDAMRPKTILEIGTARGGTLFLLARIAAQDAEMISIDLPEGSFGGGYPERLAPLISSFARPGQRINLLRADSHSPETLAEVENILAGRNLDLLFIDGDHEYEGVKTDFNMYSGLVRKDGLIALHDIVPGDPSIVGGVPRFWNEVKVGRETTEIIKDMRQGGFGIGLVKV
ncbi:MAG: class I SAM-dependent methyltransferase [Thermoplasmata archaeon]|nr:class I SAM-dependent methyltransferase [Thermoplasmata archaeon]